MGGGLWWNDSDPSYSEEATGLTDDEMEDLYEVDENLTDEMIREIFQSDDEEEELLGY